MIEQQERIEARAHGRPKRADFAKRVSGSG